MYSLLISLKFCFYSKGLTCAGYFDSSSNAESCFQTTLCGLGQFQSVAPTLTSNAVCANISTCLPGQYVLQNATATSDRGCASCIPGIVMIFISDLQSFPLSPPIPTPCNVIWQLFATLLNTLLRNTTPTSDRICSMYSICGPGHYISMNATSTSDRDVHLCPQGSCPIVD